MWNIPAEYKASIAKLHKLRTRARGMENVDRNFNLSDSPQGLCVRLYVHAAHCIYMTKL